MQPGRMELQLTWIRSWRRCLTCDVGEKHELVKGSFDRSLGKDVVEMKTEEEERLAPDRRHCVWPEEVRAKVRLLSSIVIFFESYSVPRSKSIT